MLTSKVTPQRPGTGGPDKDLLASLGSRGDGEGLAKGGQKEVTMLVEPAEHGIPERAPSVPKVFPLRSGSPGLRKTLAVAFRTLRSRSRGSQEASPKARADRCRAYVAGLGPGGVSASAQRR